MFNAYVNDDALHSDASAYDDVLHSDATYDDDYHSDGNNLIKCSPRVE